MTCLNTISFSIIINGNTSKPFDAKKGSEARRPYIPLPICVSDGVLEQSIKTIGENPNFNFHPKCAKLSIIQLGFADDLLLFCRGDVASVRYLIEHFLHFSTISGVIANPAKSSVHFGGMNTYVQQEILQILGFTKGELPFKYLGVPLSSKRVSCV